MHMYVGTRYCSFCHGRTGANAYNTYVHVSHAVPFERYPAFDWPKKLRHNI